MGETEPGPGVDGRGRVCLPGLGIVTPVLGEGSVVDGKRKTFDGKSLGRACGDKWPSLLAAPLLLFSVLHARRLTVAGMLHLLIGLSERQALAWLGLSNISSVC